MPALSYKNHVGIARRHDPIRTWTGADAARHDGVQLPGLLSEANTAGDVSADTAYRSKQNEAYLARHGFRSRIHRKKPSGKPMARNVARANGEKSKVRAAVEHIFAGQKGPMRLVVRTIGLARARTKIGLATSRTTWSRQSFSPDLGRGRPDERDHEHQSGSHHRSRIIDEAHNKSAKSSDAHDILPDAAVKSVFKGVQLDNEVKRPKSDGVSVGPWGLTFDPPPSPSWALAAQAA